jgi:hypothetical protein
MKDIYQPKKLSIPLRRIEIAGISYAIRPSFAMPYLTGVTTDIEKALFFRNFSALFWALSHLFGKDPMYWYGIEQRLGRNSIVGTSVKDPDDIPEHLGADEKHTWILGEKVYVATTVGMGCILGTSIAKNAGEQALKDAYQVFRLSRQKMVGKLIYVYIIVRKMG